MHLKNEKGFTLLESLFVLSIFLLILSMSFLPLRPQQNQLEAKLFFSQLKSDLLYAQQYAVTNQCLVRVNFMSTENHYYIRKQSGEVLIRRDYSNKIIIREGSQLLHFYYLYSGNINSFGSIYVYIDKKRYQMTFQLGGRFYVKEG
jgi:competence protein ComGD